MGIDSYGWIDLDSLCGAPPSQGKAGYASLAGNPGLYEFLIKRLKAFYQAAGLRPAATAAKKRSQYISYRRPGGLP